MSGQIIKQPNGKFCIFSRIIDNVTYSNVTPEQIIEILVAEAREDITDEVNNIIAKIENDKIENLQFILSYNDMLEFIKEIHGKKEYNRVKSVIESTDL